MITRKLSAIEREQGDFTDAIDITFADLTQTTANTAQLLTGTALAIGDLITKVAVYCPTPFQNSADSAFNTTAITVGDTASASTWIGSMELNANGTTVQQKVSSAGAKVYAAADALTVTFNAMSGKALSALNTGKVTVLFTLVHLPQLAA